jgi:formylglycine-generating enzyme required for sulfatase activity
MASCFVAGLQLLLYPCDRARPPGVQAVSRLFISHSSGNDDWALALQAWLIREGWSGEGDIFLDLDPERGIVAGQRWARALEDAATRCEAVLFLVSEVWLASTWCGDEYQLASRLNKKLFALLIDEIPLDRLPGGLTAQWQVVHLKGGPAERFLTVHPRTQHQSPVHIAEAALKSLKRGLAKAGIGPETFDLEPDASGPFGWRAPYRGLEALEPEDAAVFFGRSADIVRGIDALRGLAARKPPRLLVILGASGGGKSSFLRAGLWPRLARDDSQWLPLRAIRAGRGGAIEGSEGLLSALEDVHRRFALRASRADLRQRLADPKSFVALLHELRKAAARRALMSAPPYPLPLLCLDQGEELFAADAGAESEHLLRLARAAIDADAALLLVTIRSDAYSLMQSASTLAGIDQVLLSLGPVPQGEIARIIRDPSEVLRCKAGPSAPNFDTTIVERLQSEIAGEMDALPLLAFVLQRLMREHSGTSTIGVKELEQTGGVAVAIEQEAEAALGDAGYGPDRAERREVLRRLFIPRLARIDRDSKAPQRRVARQSNLPADLLGLARALIQRRLLVAKVASGDTTDSDAAKLEAGAATLEVAHEALLRRWPTLADLLREDRDALLLLDGMLVAAHDWEKADATHKPDFLAHRGSRLSDAQALASRGSDWAREVAPAQAYLTACTQRETAEREEREAALAREQERLAEIAAGQARTARLQRITRLALTAVGAIMVGSIAGLIGWINQSYLREQLNWYTTVRPYMLRQIRPYVLTAAAERALKPGDSFRECAKDCPEMVVVSAGEFMMGSPADERDHHANEDPLHRVTIARPLAVSKFEVTFEQWDACVDFGTCAHGPHSNMGGGTEPVINVSWDDVQQYVAWFSKMTSRPYRLLSEAEWEYAARAGTTTAYSWGNDIGKNNANCNGCGSEWDRRKIAPVGSFAPNQFGLYDMHGNVWEWVEDCLHTNYEGAPEDGSAWIAQGDCNFRGVRGGSWYHVPEVLRAANRGRNSSGSRDDGVGFRIGRTLNP